MYTVVVCKPVPTQKRRWRPPPSRRDATRRASTEASDPIYHVAFGLMQELDRHAELALRHRGCFLVPRRSLPLSRPGPVDAESAALVLSRSARLRRLSLLGRKVASSRLAGKISARHFRRHRHCGSHREIPRRGRIPKTSTLISLLWISRRRSPSVPLPPLIMYCASECSSFGSAELPTRHACRRWNDNAMAVVRRGQSWIARRGWWRGGAPWCHARADW